MTLECNFTNLSWGGGGGGGGRVLIKLTSGAGFMKRT